MHLQHRKSIHGLIYLINAMQGAGIDITLRLESIGLAVETLDAEAVIDVELQAKIYQHLLAGLHVEDALLIGRQYRFLVGQGPLLMLLRSAATVEQAIHQGIYFQQITYLHGNLRLEMQQDQLVLSYDLPDYRQQQSHCLIGLCEMASLYHLIRGLHYLAGLTLPKMTLHLSMPQPEDAALLQAYQQCYGNKICFAAKENAIYLTGVDLKHHLETADPLAYRIYLKHCHHALHRLQQQQHSQRLLQQVYDYLYLQQGCMASVTATARVMQRAERTLRYQLQQLGSSYKQIREQVIQQKALAMVQAKQYSIVHIAKILGYSETAAFNHAFKRWFGQSPSQFHKSTSRYS
ncbi:helix-turn-helix domain-containing protein [Acinetobacter larvae]|uniref:HTH araC/xylS-type domain-containing protein n=1 Tax=Acinetobacter larvae TaxID=1789224 RepID=A0A1B2M3W9_9GAMM|nr:AraC family transcriptional regulator [Acinetobacter larvae]AOA59900.1 hypothetical protein BFG52_06180 [Acinetobacter larvae]